MTVAMILLSIVSASLALPSFPANSHCQQRFDIRATDVPAVFPKTVRIDANEVRVRFELMDQNMKSFPTSSPHPFENSFVFIVVDNEPPVMIDVSNYPNPWTFVMTVGNLPNGRHKMSIGFKMQQYPSDWSVFQACFSTPDSKTISEFQPIS